MFKKYILVFSFWVLFSNLGYRFLFFIFYFQVEENVKLDVNSYFSFDKSLAFDMYIYFLIF